MIFDHGTAILLFLPLNQPRGTQVDLSLKYDENGNIMGRGVFHTSEDEKIEIPINLTMLDSEVR
jgi:uncharacterized protein YuzE